MQPVTREVFEDLVEQALASIPASLQRHLENVVIDVEDMPDARTCRALGIDDPRRLLGLYHGVPLTGRHVEAPAPLPDRISIYQRNIERVCSTRAELVRQIRTTVLHEVGHYFGLDEDDLSELGYG
ncbi:MAG: metallopeptidase family protein [Phycisphaerales bacterium]|nr:metallopeptidase family protein [Phycisphaerales bacterium]